MTSEEDVYDALMKIGPNDAETVAQFLYADHIKCHNCGREYMEYRRHKKDVQTMISRLIADGRVDGDMEEYWVT